MTELEAALCGVGNYWCTTRQDLKAAKRKVYAPKHHSGVDHVRQLELGSIVTTGEGHMHLLEPIIENFSFTKYTQNKQ